MRVSVFHWNILLCTFLAFYTTRMEESNSKHGQLTAPHDTRMWWSAAGFLIAGWKLVPGLHQVGDHYICLNRATADLWKIPPHTLPIQTWGIHHAFCIALCNFCVVQYNVKPPWMYSSHYVGQRSVQKCLWIADFDSLKLAIMQMFPLVAFPVKWPPERGIFFPIYDFCVGSIKPPNEDPLVCGLFDDG